MRTSHIERAVVDRLLLLETIAKAIRALTVADPRARVTFAELAEAVGPKVDRIPSPAFYRDLRHACKLIGIVTARKRKSVKVARGIRLR